MNSNTLFFSTMFISSLIIWIGGLIGSWSWCEYKKFVAASIPSWCGIFVYSEETSMLTRIDEVGILVVVISSTKCLVSLLKDGSPFIIGCSQ